MEGRPRVRARIAEAPPVDPVLYELNDHVATITYNRPEVMNAINGDMRRGLNAAFGRFRDDDDAWIAIVTRAGRAFCAGAASGTDRGPPGNSRGPSGRSPL